MKHETNTSWMTEVPINIHKWKIISCSDAKTPSDAANFKENYTLKKRYKRAGANFWSSNRNKSVQEQQNLVPGLHTEHECATIHKSIDNLNNHSIALYDSLMFFAIKTNQHSEFVTNQMPVSSLNFTKQIILFHI